MGNCKKRRAADCSVCKVAEICKEFMAKEIVEDKNLLEKFDQAGYEYYVVKDSKIDSGWEYREDAQDAAREFYEEGICCTVESDGCLIDQGIDPDDNNNWANASAAP